MHGSSDSCPSPSSSSYFQQPSLLRVSGGGGWQELPPPYYPSHAASQIQSVSSDLGSPLSMHSLASSLPHYPSLASPTYPTEHSPSLGATTTVAAANTDHQEPMSMNCAYLVHTVHTMPSSLGTALFPYGPVPTTPLPVVYDLTPETPEPIAKKRKRLTPQQFKVLDRVYARNAYPPTIQRQQIARDLDMTARRVQVWLAHIFVYTACIISESSTILSRFQNRRQKDRDLVRRRNRANSPINVTLPPDTSTVIAHFYDSPALSSPTGESPYSCSPLPDMM